MMKNELIPELHSHKVFSRFIIILALYSLFKVSDILNAIPVNSLLVIFKKTINVKKVSLLKSKLGQDIASVEFV